MTYDLRPTTFFRKNIDEMTGYIPGEQPAPGQKVIKLNTNENPYPPSPAAMEVLRHFDGEALRMYSDPMATPVRQAVGKVLGVDPSWVLAGNGSDDLLTMIFKACCEKGRGVAYAMPTYVYFRTLANVQDAPFTEIPFDDEYTLPVDALAKANAPVTFVANPNSPSGTCTPVAVLDDLASRLAGLLIVDEAYVDFAQASALDLVKRHKNVIVLRTLSKGYSLAGLRVGFGVMQPALVPTLVKVKDHYNVSSIACAVAAAAIADQAYLRQTVEKVKAARRQLTEGLRALDYRVWPSESNFVLAQVPGGAAQKVYLALKSQGILVRYFKEPRLEDKLRITVGTAEQVAALLAALGARASS